MDALFNDFEALVEVGWLSLRVLAILFSPVGDAFYDEKDELVEDGRIIGTE